MNSEILSILRCPISGGELTAVEQDRLAELNAIIKEGRLKHACGRQVGMEISEALASCGGRFIWPIVDGIFVLLPGLAVVCDDGGTPGDANVPSVSPDQTDSVMRFYDETGWRKDESGHFTDAECFEDLRPVSAEYIHKCHLRVARHIAESGRFLLDIASGPIQYPEYLTYSEKYDFRICGDISISALRAAKQKLGEKGIYLQCDITRLPLVDNCVDAFVSLHTIYHVPAEKQATAFRELSRVLSAGKSGVAVYSWGRHCVAMRLLAAAALPLIMFKRAIKALRSRFSTRPQRTCYAAEPVPAAASAPDVSGAAGNRELYFHPHSWRWFRRSVAAVGGWQLSVWRSVSVPFMKYCIHGRPGAALLGAIYRLEEALPRFLARFGQYPMMIFSKK